MSVPCSHLSASARLEKVRPWDGDRSRPGEAKSLDSSGLRDERPGDRTTARPLHFRRVRGRPERNAPEVPDERNRDPPLHGPRGEATLHFPPRSGARHLGTVPPLLGAARPPARAGPLPAPVPPRAPRADRPRDHGPRPVHRAAAEDALLRLEQLPRPPPPPEGRLGRPPDPRRHRVRNPERPDAGRNE